MKKRSDFCDNENIKLPDKHTLTGKNNVTGPEVSIYLVLSFFFLTLSHQSSSFFETNMQTNETKKKTQESLTSLHVYLTVETLNIERSMCGAAASSLVCSSLDQAVHVQSPGWGHLCCVRGKDTFFSHSASLPLGV